MANSVAKDIATLLAANGFGTLGTNIFGMEWGPDSTDAQILIIDVIGVDTQDKDQYEHPSFQILKRGERAGSASDVYDDIKAIHNFLIQQAESVTINATDYLGFEPLGSIGGLGRDDNDRYVYSMNYTTFRNPD